MDDTQRLCKDCNQSKSLCEFEKTRKVCKTCRKERRKQSVANAKQPIDATCPLSHHCSQCHKTAADGATFGRRTDSVSLAWKSFCRDCYGSKKYDMSYRAREKAKDKSGYLARNAESMSRWRKNNKEHWSDYWKQYKLSVPYKLSTIRTSAKQRGIPYHKEDEQVFIKLVQESCRYCGTLPEGTNGLDRVDPSLGYTSSNCVPCCAMCNFMKGTNTLNVFLGKVCKIVQNNSEKICSIRSTQKDITFETGMGCKKKKNDKSNYLTTSQKQTLQNGSCYLCGQPPPSGIDRVDSSQAYTLENCRSCCKICNYMKKDFDLDAFFIQCDKIQSNYLRTK